MRRRDVLSAFAAGMTAAWWPSSESFARETRAIEAWAPVFARLPEALRARLDDPETRVQLLWTRILRDPRTPNARPRVRRYAYGETPRRWFSPASVSKLPMALLMAERLSAHGLDAHASIRLNAAPETGEWPADEPLEETFLRGCARTFTISENVPYNRWYEVLGGDAIHARLKALGYPNTRLIARLGSPDREANRRTRGGELRAADGRVVARSEAATAAPRRFPFGRALDGLGWKRDDGRIEAGPHDFSYANFMPLADSFGMLQAFVMPETVPASRRWRIDEPLRAQLLQALALRPRDSDDPRYDEAQYPDGYARWFVVGDGTARYPDGLRVLGKTGMAYGHLSEVAYMRDEASGAEWCLAAAIRADRDGIYNDDHYDYDDVGLPFLAALGRAVRDVEREAMSKRTERARP